MAILMYPKIIDDRCDTNIRLRDSATRRRAFFVVYPIFVNIGTMSIGRFLLYRTLLDAGIGNIEETSRKIKEAFVSHPNRLQSEKEMRAVRQQVTFAVFAEEDDLDKVTMIVDDLFTLLGKAQRIKAWGAGRIKQSSKRESASGPASSM